MKKNLYMTLATLVVFVLTACQATPTASPTPTVTPTPAAPSTSDFFKDDATHWITVNPPAGWVAKPGGTTAAPVVVISNDWAGYESSEPTAVGITISPLDDKGSAADVLQNVVGRFGTLLKKPTGEMIQEQANGQSYASIEYERTPNQAPSYYLMTVISNGKRNVLVLTSVFEPQEEEIKSTFQDIVKSIIVH